MNSLFDNLFYNAFLFLFQGIVLAALNLSLRLNELVIVLQEEDSELFGEELQGMCRVSNLRFQAAIQRYLHVCHLRVEDVLVFGGGWLLFQHSSNCRSFLSLLIYLARFWSPLSRISEVIRVLEAPDWRDKWVTSLIFVNSRWHLLLNSVIQHRRWVLMLIVDVIRCYLKISLVPFSALVSSNQYYLSLSIKITKCVSRALPDKGVDPGNATSEPR